MAWLSVVLTVLAACGRLGFTTTIASGDDSTDASLGDAPLVDSSAILFVRGGPGTVGLNNVGGDSNACDIGEHANGEGWGALGDRLETLGFTIVQHVEGPLAARAPADLSDLEQYGVVVLGSNNFAYGQADGEALDAYVRAGGGVLLISDAGWCKTTFAEAPSSDQVFASHFDLAIDQDSGIGTPTTFTSAQFSAPNHPILAGVASFQAIGTSPITILDAIGDVTPEVLVPVTGQVRNNDAPMGTLRNATAADGALVVASVGAGRVAAFFDRDVWTNGPLGTRDNRLLADNLFRWLHREI